MRVGPEHLVYLLVVMLFAIGVPLYGIIDARKRLASTTASTLSIVAAGFWLLVLIPSVALGPSVMDLISAGLSAYWFYLANQVNRSSGSSMHLF